MKPPIVATATIAAMKAILTFAPSALMPALGPALMTEATGFLPVGPFGPLMSFVVLVGPLVAGDLSVTGISAQAAVLATVKPTRWTHPASASIAELGGVGRWPCSRG